MGLEDMRGKLKNWEKEAEIAVKKIPWWAKILYAPKYLKLKKSIKKAKELKQRKEDTPAWYMEYGKTIDAGMKAVVEAVGTTYSVYNVVRKIPLLGKYVETAAENFFNESLIPMVEGYVPDEVLDDYREHRTAAANDSLSFRLPEKESTMNLLSRAKETVLVGYSQYAAVETDTSVGLYIDGLIDPNSPLKNKSNPLIASFMGLTNKLSDYIQDTFYYS